MGNLSYISCECIIPWPDTEVNALQFPVLQNFTRIKSTEFGVKVRKTKFSIFGGQEVFWGGRGYSGEHEIWNQKRKTKFSIWGGILGEHEIWTGEHEIWNQKRKTKFSIWAGILGNMKVGLRKEKQCFQFWGGILGNMKFGLR